PVFQSKCGRRRAALSAPVLVLRTSRGVHHISTRDSYCLLPRPSFFTTSYFWIRANCVLGGSDWVYRFRGLGAPHVRHRVAADQRKLFHGGQPDDRDSHRSAVLLLD